MGAERLDQLHSIRIDGREYTVEDVSVTGAEVLALVDKRPGEWLLNGKLHDGARQRIGLDEVVDLAASRIERFETVPMQMQQGG